MYADCPNSSAVDEREEVTALANKLKAPMAAQGVAMREYIGETLLPVITRVKDVHATLEAKSKELRASCDAHTIMLSSLCFVVDLQFAGGLVAFDQVCKKVERMALRDEDELKTTYSDCQVSVYVPCMDALPTPLQQNMEHIYERLQEAYCRRDRLWVDVLQDVDQCGE